MGAWNDVMSQSNTGGSSNPFGVAEVLYVQLSDIHVATISSYKGKRVIFIDRDLEI